MKVGILLSSNSAINRNTRKKKNFYYLTKIETKSALFRNFSTEEILMYYKVISV